MLLSVSRGDAMRRPMPPGHRRTEAPHDGAVLGWEDGDLGGRDGDLLGSGGPAGEKLPLHRVIPKQGRFCPNRAEE